MKINEFTICLHCGSSRDIVDKQINDLKSLESEYKIYWNKRIDRYPLIYPSYSQMINHSIVTSPTEIVILMNDRIKPKPEDIRKMINHLENGFACTGLWGVALIAFSKELVRTIGWWDERFIQGGWEDRDWTWRLRLADLAIYESCEAEYDFSWRSPLNHAPGCTFSTPHWQRKYDTKNHDVIYKRLKEEKYQHWDLSLWNIPKEDISKTWKKWNESILALEYNKPNAGPASSKLLKSDNVTLWDSFDTGHYRKIIERY